MASDGGVGAAMLTIEAGGAEVLVPFVQEICVAVDLDARVIRVQMPDGLRELNEARPPRRTKDRRGTKERPGSPGVASSDG